MLTAKQIAAYARMCRKEGVSYLKVDGLEISLADKRIEEPKSTAERSEAGSEATAQIAEALPAYSEEDILFWSSGPTNV